MAILTLFHHSMLIFTHKIVRDDQRNEKKDIKTKGKKQKILCRQKRRKVKAIEVERMKKIQLCSGKDPFSRDS